jgi:hypothetical protein
MKNIPVLKAVNMSKTYLRRYKRVFEKHETRFICLFWSVSMLPDPDPHSQSGSREPNKCGSNEIRILVRLQIQKIAFLHEKYTGTKSS